MEVDGRDHCFPLLNTLYATTGEAYLHINHNPLKVKSKPTGITLQKLAEVLSS